MDRGPDDVMKIWGHIGERDEDGEWSRFDFEVMDNNTGDLNKISIGLDDLGDLDWDDLFDYLEDYADEHDIDYDNPYGEK